MALTVVWLVVITALGAARHAAAQDRVFVAGGVPQMPYTEEIAADARFGESRGPRSPLVHQPLIGGGRYVAATTSACDLTPCTIADAQGVARALPHTFVSIAATDPVRPRVFVQTATGAVDAVDVETGVVTPMFTSATPMAGPCHYAHAAARLFCLERGTAPSLRVFSTDGTAGEVPRLAGIASRGQPWLVTPDGERLFAGEPGATASRLVLTVIATGTRTAIDLPWFWDLVWDDYHERLLVAPAPQVGHAFTKNLAYLGSASFPFTATAISVSAATGRLYARGLAAQSAGYGDAYTAAFDGGTYAQLTPTVHSQGFGGPPRVTVLSPPGAPRRVSAEVEAGDVTIRWTSVGAAAVFLLDVGFTPAHTAFTVAVPATTTASFAAVPPGRYYVRVRGANAFGVGQPSSDVRVVIP